MQITINYNNLEEFIEKWLTVWSVEFSLSPKEINILKVIISKYLLLSSKNLNKDEITELLFSSKARKEYQKLCGINENTFNFYLSDLRKRKLIYKNQIYKKLIPENTLTFEFKLNKETVINE